MLIRGGSWGCLGRGGGSCGGECRQLYLNNRKYVNKNKKIFHCYLKHDKATKFSLSNLCQILCFLNWWKLETVTHLLKLNTYTPTSFLPLLINPFSQWPSCLLDTSQDYLKTSCPPSCLCSLIRRALNYYSVSNPCWAACVCYSQIKMH